MNATIQQTGPADYELRLDAPAAELEGKLLAELKKYKGRVQMKGFRPGRVPIGMLRKMYGEGVAQEVAEREVQEAFDLEVVANPAYDVIGAPVITEMAYDGTSDFSAVVAFGVRPDVEIGDLSDLTLGKLVHEVTDEEVDEQIDELREKFAEYADAEEGTTLDTDHFVTVDISLLEGGEPVEDSTEEGVRFQLGDDKVKDQLAAALRGKTVGDTFDVTLPQTEDEDSEMRDYRVTVTKIETQTLPEVDDAFASKATGSKVESVDALRADITSELSRSWEGRNREYLETQFVDALTETYPIDVPNSAVSIFQDAFVQRAKEQLGGQLPKGFDMSGLRERMRPEAEEQARWMIIRDALVKREEITVGDEEIDAYFAEQAGGEIDPGLLRNYYAQQEGVMDQLVGRLESERLFDKLATMVTLEDKTQEEVEADLKARRDKRAEAQAARTVDEVVEATSDDEAFEVVDASGEGASEEQEG